MPSNNCNLRSRVVGVVSDCFGDVGFCWTSIGFNRVRGIVERKCLRTLRRKVCERRWYEWW